MLQIQLCFPHPGCRSTPQRRSCTSDHKLIGRGQLRRRFSSLLWWRGQGTGRTRGCLNGRLLSGEHSAQLTLDSESQSSAQRERVAVSGWRCGACQLRSNEVVSFSKICLMTWTGFLPLCAARPPPVCFLPSPRCFCACEQMALRRRGIIHFRNGSQKERRRNSPHTCPAHLTLRVYSLLFTRH